MKILSVAVFKQSPIVLADIIGRDVLRRCVVIMAPGFARAIMPPVIIKWELSFVRTLMWWRVLSRGSRIMLKVLFRVSHCEERILYASISGLTTKRGALVCTREHPHPASHIAADFRVIRSEAAYRAPGEIN